MKRVILGTRAGVIGAFISRPGFNVDTCTPDQMLFASDQWMYQPIQSGWTPVSYSTPTSVPLVAALSGRSRVHVAITSAVMYFGSTVITDGLNGDPSISAFVSGGFLTLDAANRDGLWPTSSTLYIGWTIFRGLY